MFTAQRQHLCTTKRGQGMYHLTQVYPNSVLHLLDARIAFWILVDEHLPKHAKECRE